MEKKIINVRRLLLVGLILFSLSPVCNLLAKDSVLIKKETSHTIVNPSILTVKMASPNTMLEQNFHVIRSNSLGFYDISVPDGIDINEYRLELLASGLFESVEYNYFSYQSETNASLYNRVPDLELPYSIINNTLTSTYPDDCALSFLYHLEWTNTYNAWDITMGLPSVKVAVLSSGIDYSHEDLGTGSDNYKNINESTQPRQTVEQAPPILHNCTSRVVTCTPSAASALTIR